MLVDCGRWHSLKEWEMGRVGHGAPYLSVQLFLSTSCNCLSGRWSCRGRTSLQRLGKAKGRVPSARLCMRKSYVWGSPSPCWGKTFRAATLEVTQLLHTCSVSKPSVLIDFPGRPLAKLNFAFWLGLKWRGYRDCKSFLRKKFSKPPPIRPHLQQVPSLPNTVTLGIKPFIPKVLGNTPPKPPLPYWHHRSMPALQKTWRTQQTLSFKTLDMIFWYLKKPPWYGVGLSFFSGSGPPNTMLKKPNPVWRQRFCRKETVQRNRYESGLSGPLRATSRFYGAGLKSKHPRSQKLQTLLHFPFWKWNIDCL